MSDEEKKRYVFPLDGEDWKRMTPAQRLEHANQLHQQMIQAMQEETDVNTDTEE